MTLSFLNAGWWPLALLVAVPLLVHLLARARPPVRAFSSAEFLLQALRLRIRLKRPRNWLLLVLRTLLFAALLAMLNPGKPEGSRK